MASIFSKYQKCSKLNCKCKDGALHGPYFWHVKYVKKTEEKKGHYQWKYLGRSPEMAAYKLSKLDGELSSHLDAEQIKGKEERAKKLALAKIHGKKSVSIKIEV